MKKIMKYTLTLIIVIIVLLGVGFTIGSVGSIPDNAIVYADTNTKIFYSPLSLTQEKVTALSLKKSTIKEAEAMGYKRDEEDKQNGYYQQDGRSLTGICWKKWVYYLN